jgi:hypothetical protein
MAIFDRLDRMNSRQVDRAFSRRAVLQPMVKTPNGRPSIDSSRPTQNIKGIFDQAASYHQVEIGERSRSGNDLRALATGSEFQFSFDLTRYPYAGQIKQGDLLTLDDDRQFEVLTVERDGLSRAVARLTRYEG